MRRVHELIREGLREGKISNYARPYAVALLSLASLDGQYGFDDGRSIARYFLSNASSWRGDSAKECKALLKEMLK